MPKIERINFRRARRHYELLLMEAMIAPPGGALLDDAEMVAVVLWNSLETHHSRVSLKQPRLSQRVFSLEDFEERHMSCEAAYRLTRGEIIVLCAALQIPEQFVTSHRDVFPGWEALAILLRRLANPVR